MSYRDENPIDIRSLLIRAPESAARTELEKEMLREYKLTTSQFLDEMKRLREISMQIDLCTGLTNFLKRKKLKSEAKEAADYIDYCCKKIERLEKSEPLMNIAARENELALKKKEQERQESKKDSEEKSENSDSPDTPDNEIYGQAWLQIVGKTEREKGLQTMKELSDKGFIEATIALAMFTKDPVERKALYKKAADQNHPEGLWGYANFLEHSFIPDPDDPEDAEWEEYCLKAAQNGSADAMNEMGNIFNRRNMFPQSMYWYAMANANDFPNGEISLNGIAQKWLKSGKPYEYEETPGFTESKYKCAIFYLEMWAEQEFTISFNEYVSMTLAGEPIAAYLTGDYFEAIGNYEMAYKMYNAIAFENDAHGLKCYGDMLFTGRGTEKDMQGALNVYAKAAEQGDRAAMFVVGEFTRKTNVNLAAYWYGVAHSRGYQPALQRMTQLANKE